MRRANLYDLIRIYKSREAYFTKDEKTVFYSVFMDILLSSFMSDDVSDFHEEELKFYENFVKYEDSTYSDEFVIALDTWLTNLVNGVANTDNKGVISYG